MKIIFKIFSWCILLGFSSISSAPDQPQRFSAELTGSFSHFEQQIKTKIGGVKGDLLTANTELNLQLMGIYKIWKFIHAGWYFQYDVGNRENAQFDGFDALGAAQVVNLQGGAFREFWTGPVIRAQYKLAFLELGYGLLGTRSDDARNDILNSLGNSEGNFSTDPAVAWFLGIGAEVKLWKSLSLLIKAQYRVRYYDSKDGSVLDQDAVHGTQNFAPLLGLSYKL